MFFEDLTEVQGWSEAGKAYCVGYLDSAYPYPKGNVPDGFIEKLLSLPSKKTLAVSAGWHGCPFCPQEKDGFGNWFSPRIKKAHGKSAGWLGSSEIVVASKDSTRVYIMPDLIIHYIDRHNYRPPQQVIDLVMNY